MENPGTFLGCYHAEMQLAQWQEYTRLYGKLGNAAVPIALAFLRNLSTRIGEN
jgi:hypothetical protein